MITERARAKVNLTLEILGRRSDGYHQVRTLIAFARDIYDVVTLELDQPVGVEVRGKFAGVIAGPNIAEAACNAALAAQPDLRTGGFLIEKNLPVAAGIGGGSADAGAVLRALVQANPDFAPHDGNCDDGGCAGQADVIDWERLALKLGADVPVCFDNRSSLRGGIGERLDGPGLAFGLPALLVNPMQAVPSDKTAQVFKLLGAGAFDPQTDAVSPTRFASVNEQLDYIAERGNDLEAAAKIVAPGIGDVLTALRGLPGTRYAALSGAGPTCFAIVEDAEAAAALLRSKQPDWWVASTLLE